jgi:protein TonB
MAYADQSMSSRKLVAIIGVGVLHAALGYAFITGLAFNVIKKVSTDLKTFDVQEAPPPKEAPPPPPPQKVVQPPPVVSPPPIVQVQQVYTPPIISVPVAPPVIHETAPPAPPVSQAVRATPKGNFQTLMSSDDYPSASIRNNEEGTVAYRLDVGTDGRVTACSVTQSSGHPLLDETACRLLQRRARFNIGKDAAGNPTTSVYNGRFRWQVPKD